jgi:hypothetical protein
MLKQEIIPDLNQVTNSLFLAPDTIKAILQKSLEQYDTTER